MSEFQASNFKKENGGTPDLLGKTELTSPYFFVPPSGDTASRPQSCAAGTLRFNTDVGTLEIYRGDTIGWQFIERRESQHLGGGTGSNTGTGSRGVFFGGAPSGQSYTKMNFITISTLGDAGDFGDLATLHNQGAAAASSTRGIYAGGENPSHTNTIEFITISTTGDSQDFGDMTDQRRRMNGMGCSNQTRALLSGGLESGGSTVNLIDFITIAQTGNAVNFGDLSVKRESGAECASTIRGFCINGRSQPANNALVSMDSVIIATTGDAIDFGDSTLARHTNQACSNATRAINFSGGSAPAGVSNVIDFFTMASTGNAQDFGDTLFEQRNCLGAMSSSTRAVLGGGFVDPETALNVLQFVEIATTGNAVDFGDLQDAKVECSGCSNGHGGL